MVSASRFISPTTEATELAAQWAEEIDKYVMNTLGTFSIMTLQVILLWANHHHSNRSLGKAWMLLGMAARLAYCLQINGDSGARSSSEMECRRRMMWNIRILDRLLAGTVDEFSLSSRFMDALILPCDEYHYLADLQVKTEKLEAFCGDTQIPNVGGFAALIRLFDIWREILL